MRFVKCSTIVAALLLPAIAGAAEPGASLTFLEFIRRQAAELRAADTPPATLAEWEQRRAELRRQLQAAWGEFPAEPCPLEPRVLGTLQRDGYRVEKVMFQTRPGIWMTANAYVPASAGKSPAVLVVHGHWRGAKQDPVVQARCLGLVKLGFFVLAVDAFGAGERGLGTALGEYHGEMVAATLLPVGLPLCGLQVYENRRAVDYLLTRPEVDGRQIGITGASGGGNQTMYAGAWDERFSAVVPVCSVGNYQAYLGAACCMCEVVPGALRFTEEGNVLGLTAPRALMVVNATRDAVQFSVAEARKSLAWAQPIFGLYGQADHLKHAVFESPHDYNQAMRETMYGWMTQHLKGSGAGSPIPEPAVPTEDPESLRCFPGDTRPADFITIPQFAAAEGNRLVQRHAPPKDRSAMANAACRHPGRLEHLPIWRCSACGNPTALVQAASAEQVGTLTFQPEPGISLAARQEPLAPAAQKAGRRPRLGRRRESFRQPLGRALTKRRLERADLGPAGHRQAGSAQRPDRPRAGPQYGRVVAVAGASAAGPMGRSMSVACWMRSQERDGRLPDEILVVGIGPAGVVAICSAAIDARITRVAASGMLASYVTQEPYQGQRLGLLAPGILRDAGDIPHLAALIAPRPVVIGGGVTGGGQPLDAASLETAFTFTRQAYAA